METVGVPFTAWEQSVFVVLFIVLVVVLIKWFSSQQEKWQRFMGEMNRSWQDFIEAQRKEERETLDGLKKSVGDITVVTTALVQQVTELRSDVNEINSTLKDHDKSVESRVKDIQDASKSRNTKPRPTAPQ